MEISDSIEDDNSSVTIVSTPCILNHNRLSVHMIEHSNKLLHQLHENFNNCMEKYDTCLQNILKVQMDMAKDFSELSKILEIMHHAPNEDIIEKTRLNMRTTLISMRPHIAKLVDALGSEDYYRFNRCWSVNFKKLTSYICLVCYLSNPWKLPSLKDVATLLNIKHDPKEGFHLDVSDYLCGVLLFCEQLTRFSTASYLYSGVYRHDQVYELLKIIDSGFRKLTLKNNLVRKKFDGLKYLINKTEKSKISMKNTNKYVSGQ